MEHIHLLDLLASDNISTPVCLLLSASLFLPLMLDTITQMLLLHLMLAIIFLRSPRATAAVSLLHLLGSVLGYALSQESQLTVPHQEYLLT